MKKTLEFRGRLWVYVYPPIDSLGAKLGLSIYKQVITDDTLDFDPENPSYLFVDETIKMIGGGEFVKNHYNEIINHANGVTV